MAPGAADAAEPTVSATPSPPLSVNGVVRAVAVGGGKVYVGGEFTEATGANGTFERARLAAFDLLTGNVTEFRSDASATVRALVLSGQTLYVGGDFTTLAGQSRRRLAAIDAISGRPNQFSLSATSSVRALALSGDLLVVGGNFGSIGGIAQPRLALVDTRTATVVPAFRPEINATVESVAIAKDGSLIFAGGGFTTVNAASRPYLVALRQDGQDSGTTFDLASNYIPIDLSLDPTRGVIYAALAGAGNQAAAFRLSDGRKLWRQRAMGDMQAVHYHDGNVYFGFHEGFQEDLTVRLLAADAVSGQLMPFRPSMNSYWGVYDIASSAAGVVAGGAFTLVNGVATGRVAFFPAVQAPPPPPPPPPGQTYEEVLPYASAWKWRFDAATLPADWRSIDFDDAGWNTGQAPLGYGSTLIKTNIDVPTGTTRPISAQFRRVVTLDAEQAGRIAEVTTVADDGVVVYVNGVEVGRTNMPTGTLTQNTYPVASQSTSAAFSNPVTYAIPPGVLQPGMNVISAATHLGWRSTPNISFDLRLRVAAP